MFTNNFYCIEGVDGAGKTTLIKALSDCNNIKTSYEPTDGQYGILAKEMIDSNKIDNEKLLTLILQDREEHQQWIKQSLDEGYTVFLDRYIPSTMAYQGLNFPAERLFRLNEHFLQPKIIFFLNTDINEIKKRNKNRIKDGYQSSFFDSKIDDVLNSYYFSLNYLRNKGFKIVLLNTNLEIPELLVEIFKHIDFDYF